MLVKDATAPLLRHANGKVDGGRSNVVQCFVWIQKTIAATGRAWTCESARVWLVPNASSACAHAIVAVVIHSIVHVLAHSTISHLDKSYRCGRVKAS